MEGQVVAVIPASVRSPKSVAETTLKFNLIEAHADQNSVAFRATTDLLTVAKRVYYAHETRTIRFILPDHASADRWHHATLLFKGHSPQLLSVASLEAEDNCTTNTDPKISHDALKYALRVLTRTAPALVIQQVLAVSTGADLLSIVRQQKKDREAYDSNYYVAVFQTAVCPPELVEVTHITAGKHSIYQHHHKLHPRIPCFSCYSYSHTSPRCPKRDGSRMNKHHCDFTAALGGTPPRVCRIRS